MDWYGQESVLRAKTSALTSNILVLWVTSKCYEKNEKKKSQEVTKTMWMREDNVWKPYVYGIIRIINN